MTDAVCAHLKVEYKPEELGPGTFRDRWLCCGCGTRFVIGAMAEYRVAELQRNWDQEEASHIETIKSRDFREKQVTNIYLALGGGNEWSNLHDLGEEAMELLLDLQRERERLIALLRYLDRKGGLGLDVHDLIKQTLAANEGRQGE